MARKPRVPLTSDALVRMAERDDLTPAELERLRLGGLLLVAGELGELRKALDRVDITASRVLECVVKQGSSNTDALVRLVELLAARGHG